MPKINYRGKAPVTVVCTNCKINFDVNFDTYRKRSKDHEWKCKQCMKVYMSELGKNRYKNMSIEEKENNSKNHSIGAKMFWDNNPKQKEIYSVQQKKIMNNLTTEEKESRKTKFSTWYNSQPEEFKEKKINEGKRLKKWEQDLPEEEKKKLNIKRSISVKNSKKQLTTEEYEEKIRLKNINKYTMVKCNNCGFEFQITTNSFRKKKNINRIDWICKKCRKEIIGEKISKTKKEIWDNKTPEEREEHRKNTSLGMQKMSEKDFLKWNKSHSEGIASSKKLRGPTESIFANDLNKYGIKYKWGYSNNTIHPDFYNTFGKTNPITIGNISPYKAWDFLIYTKHGNILVDVDGAKHDPNKNDFMVTYKNTRFKLRDLMKFNDSQRSYQTDGIDAYIVEAYDDIINNNTKVLHIKNNKSIEESDEYINYKDLLTMIQLMNYSDKELREIL